MQTQLEQGRGREDRIENDIRAGLPDELDRERAIAAVLTAMTRRMSRGEARRIIGALPERYRRSLARDVEARSEEAPRAGRAEVIADVAEALQVDARAAEEVTRTVLRAIGRHLPPGLLRSALAQLPRGVASLWGSRVEGPGPGPVPIRPRTLVVEVDPDLDVEHPVTRELERIHAVPEGFTGASTFSIVLSIATRRLSRGEVVRIASALPAPLRGLLDPVLASREEPPEVFDRDVLIERLAERFDIDRPSAELVARAVFGCLHDLLGAHETRNIESQLPEDIAELWRLGQTRLTEVGRPTKVRRAVMPNHRPSRKRRDQLQR